MSNQEKPRVTCPYCDKLAKLVTGKVVYPHRPDLHEKKIWHCAGCQAWVGTHPGTEKPLGRLANAELRSLKMAAHRAFDPLWKEDGRIKRGDAYKWLANQRGIDYVDCHIGEFDEETCRRVVEVCRNPTSRPRPAGAEAAS